MRLLPPKARAANQQILAKAELQARDINGSSATWRLRKVLALVGVMITGLVGQSYIATSSFQQEVRALYSTTKDLNPTIKAIEMELPMELDLEEDKSAMEKEAFKKLNQDNKADLLTPSSSSTAAAAAVQPAVQTADLKSSSTAAPTAAPVTPASAVIASANPTNYPTAAPTSNTKTTPTIPVIPKTNDNNLRHNITTTNTPKSTLKKNITKMLQPIINTTTTAFQSQTQSKQEQLANQQQETVLPPIPLANMSILEYQACCGLGHRLIRQSAAYHAAHRLGFRLFVNWGKCGENPSNQVDVFDSLFAPEELTEMAYVNSAHEYLRIGNEVPGYRHPPNPRCYQEDLDSDYDHYMSLRRRYRRANFINAFTQQHDFANSFVIGLHIRAGNGETGDFAGKGREVPATPEEYTQRVTDHIQHLLQRTLWNTTLLQQSQHRHQRRHLHGSRRLNNYTVAEANTHHNNAKKPILFIATDTARYIGLFEEKMTPLGVKVLAWNQEHEPEGSGVFAGQGTKVETQDKCLQKWYDMFADMALLSHADVLIAGQYSSFSQTAPLSLVANKPQQERKVPQIKEAFCEVVEEGNQFVCHDSVYDWCNSGRRRQPNLVKALLRNVGNNPGIIDGWDEFLQFMTDDPWYYNHTDNPAAYIGIRRQRKLAPHELD